MKKYIAYIVTIICIITTIVPLANVSADSSETESVAPISSFVMNNVTKGNNIIFNSNDQFAFTVYDVNGKKVEPVEYGKYDENGVWHKETNISEEMIPQYISEVNYTYAIEEKKVKNGYGTYEIKVKASERYGGVILRKTITIIPNADAVRMTFFYYRDSSYRINGVSDAYHVEASYNKTVSKNLDGVQYVYAKDKKFKKIYKKGTMKLTTPKNIKSSKRDSGSKGKIGPTIPNIKYGKCYVKWRVYKKINGKKVYSEWKKQHMWMNGLVID